MSATSPFVIQMAEDGTTAGREHPAPTPTPLLAQRMQAARTSLVELAEVLGAHPFDLRRDPGAFVYQLSVAALVRLSHLLDVPVCALLVAEGRDALGEPAPACPHEAEHRGEAGEDDPAGALLAVLTATNTWIREEDLATILGWSLEKTSETIALVVAKIHAVEEIQLLCEGGSVLLRGRMAALDGEQARRLEAHLLGEPGQIDPAAMGQLLDMCHLGQSYDANKAWWQWAGLVRHGWVEVDEYFMKLGPSERVAYSLGLEGMKDQAAAEGAVEEDAGSER